MFVDIRSVVYGNQKIPQWKTKRIFLSMLCFVLVLVITAIILYIGQFKKENVKFSSAGEELEQVVNNSTRFIREKKVNEEFNKTKFDKEMENVSTSGDIAENNETDSSSLPVSKMLNKMINNIMIPGTKWCGAGSTTTSFDDLGTFPETDKCCREHDSCPDSIKVGQNKHGLVNDGFFVWSRCDCDQKFFECLKSAQETLAHVVGFGYFTVIGPKCFKKEYEVVSCASYEYAAVTLKKGSRKRCSKYIFSNESERKYQWFDNLIYV